MTAEIVKLPYTVTRKLHARKPRKSKNGTPEERAAFAARAAPAPAAIVDPGAGAQVIAFPDPVPAAQSQRSLYSDAFFRLPFVTLPETAPAQWGEFWKVTVMWNEAAAAATYQDGVRYARDAVTAICQDGVGARQLEIVVERMIEQAFRRRDAAGKLCRQLSSSEQGFLTALCRSAVCEPPKPA